MCEEQEGPEWHCSRNGQQAATNSGCHKAHANGDGEFPVKIIFPVHYLKDQFRTTWWPIVNTCSTVTTAQEEAAGGQSVADGTQSYNKAHRIVKSGA